MSSAPGPLRWAILGVGIAGRARGRAILSDPRSELVAVHRGRYADQLGAPEVSLDDAIARADAVAVCSPNALHPEQVEQVLRADRHAIVEFPLAPTAAVAEDLLRLAKGRGKVLHVEHIEVLDAAQLALAAQVRPEAVRDIEITFERRGPENAGSADLALGNLARLHRVVHVGGPVAAVDAVEVVDGALTGILRLSRGAPVRFRFTQAPYLQRNTRMEVDATVARFVLDQRVLFRDGRPQTLLESRPLFEQDHRIATARILDGRRPYVDDARVLHVLDLVEALGALRVGPLPTRSA